MKRGKVRRLILAAAAFAAMAFVGLWAWNTVVELFGGPQIEYRHAVAVLAIPLLLRALLSTCRERHGAAHCRHSLQTGVRT